MAGTRRHASFGRGAASGQIYPTKPIRIITAPAGAGNDFMARVIAQGLTGSLGQQLVVDNRPAGIIGELVAKAQADGYTLLAVGSVLWLTPFLQDNVRVRPGEGLFTDLSHIKVAQYACRASLGLGKFRQGADRFGPIEARAVQLCSGATGASNHLAAELFKSMAGVDLVRIPYKGSGPAVNDLLSGQVHMMFPTTAAGLPHVRSGRLRALGVTSLKPSPLVPGLPAVAESGLPGYESVVIYALFAPAKTPAAIIKRLHTELVQYLRSAGTTERLFNAGVEVVASSPRELATAMESEMTRMGKLIKDAGLRGQ